MASLYDPPTDQPTADCPRCGRSCRVGPHSSAHCARCFTSFRADEPGACLTASERISAARVAGLDDLAELLDEQRRGEIHAERVRGQVRAVSIAAGRCYCPGDCGCRHTGAPFYRVNVCGCRAHEGGVA